MSKQYVNDGRTINVTASGSAIPAGSPVVVGALLAVAVADIADGATGACSIEGVHEIPATTGAAFVQGRSIVWDVSAGSANDHAASSASGDLSGGCVAMETKTAGAGDSVKVKLNVGVNAIG